MRTTGHVEFLKFQSVMWAERIFIYEFKHLQVGTICVEKNVFQNKKVRVLITKIINLFTKVTNGDSP